MTGRLTPQEIAAIRNQLGGIPFGEARLLTHIAYLDSVIAALAAGFKAADFHAQGVVSDAMHEARRVLADHEAQT